MSLWDRIASGDFHNKLKYDNPRVSTAVRAMMRRMYNEESAKLEQQFREALYEELGVQNNPKKDKLYAKAWEKGHASGFSEVFLIAQDLVELIK